MTEAEWLAATDPRPMLDSLRGKASERKLRLFAAACCRRNWHALSEDVSRPGVEVIERYADRSATARELEDVHRAARAQGKDFEKLCQWRRNTRGPSSEADSYYWDSQQAYLIAHASQRDDYLGMVLVYTTECKLRDAVGFRAATDRSAHEEWQRLRDADRADLANLFRDVFGNRFRPVTADPAWLTSTVVALASGIYADRAFDRLPILADALQDAGCDNADVLGHCRGPGPHVRGCWVVDLLLGKQ